MKREGEDNNYGKILDITIIHIYGIYVSPFDVYTFVR